MTESRSNGRSLFAALKASTTSDCIPLVLSIGSPLRATMRPISTVSGKTDETDIHLLTEWRNKYVKSFLTEFNATPERTKDWLCNSVHNNPGKMLWMVETLDGKRVGHVGLGFINWESGYGEADAIVSSGDSPQGLMKEALLRLLHWAKHTLNLNSLAVRVRSDNTALFFYKKVGFEEIKRIPITPTHTPFGIDWHENPLAENAPAQLVHMMIQLPK